MALFFLAVTSAYVFSQTHWGRQRLKEVAIETIKTELGLDATFADMQVGVFPPRIQAFGIKLDDPEYGSFAAADELEIRPSLLAVFMGGVDLDRIMLKGPTLYLLMEDGEIVNLPKPKDTTGGGEVDVPFEELKIEGARVRMDIVPLGDAELEGVNADLTRVGYQKIALSLEVAGGAFRHAKGIEKVQGAMLRGEASPEKIEVERFAFVSPFVKLYLQNGRLAFPIGSDYQGQARTRVNLTHIPNLPLGLELPPMRGVIDVQAKLERTEEGPVTSGLVVIEDGQIDQWGLGTIALPWEANEQRIKINDGIANLIADGGTVNINAELKLDEQLSLKADLGLGDIEFHKLMGQLGVSQNAIVQWTLSGKASIKGTLDPLKLDGPIKVDTRDFKVTNGPWHAADSLRIIGVPSASVRGMVRVRPDALRFDRLYAQTPKSRLRGSVKLGFDNDLHVEVATNALDVSDPSPLLEFPLAGKGSAQVEVKGTFQDPKVTGHMKLSDFAFNTFPLGNVESDMQLEHGGLAVRFPAVSVKKRESSFVAKDLILDFRDERFLTQANIAADKLALKDFYHIFHFENDERFEAFEGHVNGAIDVKYTRGFPGDQPSGTMVTDLDLHVPEAMLNGYSFERGVFKGQWKWTHWDRGYEGGILTIDEAVLKKARLDEKEEGESLRASQQGTVQLSGKMNLGGKLNLTVAADRIRIANTEGLADRMPGVTGVIGMVGRIQGTAAVPYADMDVDLSDVTYDRVPLGNARAYVRLTDRDDPWVKAAASWNPRTPPTDQQCAAARAGFYHGRWPADPPVRTKDGPRPALEKPMAFLICGKGLEQKLSLDLAIGRTSSLPLRGRLRMQDFSLNGLANRWLDAGSGGRITGEFFFDGGGIKDFEHWNGFAHFDTLALHSGDVNVRNDGPVRVNFDGGHFHFERAHFLGPASDLSLHGGGKVGGELATSINAETDLSLLETLSPMVRDAGGKLKLELRLSGLPTDPEVIGNAQLEGGELALASFDERLSNLNGRVRFSSRRISIEGFEAEFAGGRVRIAGDAKLRDLSLSEYDLRIEGNDFVLHPTLGVEVAGDTDLRLRWENGERLPMLSGTVDLERVVYSRPMVLLQNLSLGELSKQKRTDFSQYFANKDRLALNIRVRAQDNIRIANNVIDAELRIQDEEQPFRIVGTDQRFGALGSVAITRGTFLFRNVNFDIRRGIIDFDDPTKISPNFNVEAQTEIRRTTGLGPSWRIFLRLYGSSETFRLETSSEPALSQEDIVLLLTMGMTRAEADQLQTGDLTGTAALEALATVTGINREVRRAVPIIDDFQISSQYSPVTNQPEPRITVGKRLADDLRMSASTGLGDSRQIQTALEWRLSDKTSIQTAYDNINAETASSLGNIGLDIRWRLEFK